MILEFCVVSYDFASYSGFISTILVEAYLTYFITLPRWFASFEICSAHTSLWLEKRWVGKAVRLRCCDTARGVVNWPVQQMLCLTHAVIEISLAIIHKAITFSLPISTAFEIIRFPTDEPPSSKLPDLRHTLPPSQSSTFYMAWWSNRMSRFGIGICRGWVARMVREDLTTKAGRNNTEDSGWPLDKSEYHKL